jgi:hypothetical protein
LRYSLRLNSDHLPFKAQMASAGRPASTQAVGGLREARMAQLDPNDAPTGRPDPYPNDPFFKRKYDAKWNARIGRQGHEENYLDGYIEAAMELAGAVIEKKMFEKRDTLVLPILHNARHAVELSLKFVTDRLAAVGLVPAPERRNHNIKAYWDRLHAASLGDEKLSQTIMAMKAFIDSLSLIDRDGQELRYHLNNADDPSLSEYSLANLEVIRESLSELSEIISVLKYRTMSFLDERETGTYTNRCSRHDLLVIAQLMPCREFCSDGIFDQQKTLVKARFNLSNRQFSKALDVIQSNREMKAILGVETPLLHISDDEIVWVVEQWRRLHPPRDEDVNDLGIRLYDETALEAMIEHLAVENEVVAEIEKRIAGDKLAEVEAIFYLSRDRIFPEYYEQYAEETKKEHAAANDPKAKIGHLMEKTNFLHCVQLSATKLGRLSLAKRLEKL